MICTVIIVEICFVFFAKIMFTSVLGDTHTISFFCLNSKSVVNTQSCAVFADYFHPFFMIFTHCGFYCSFKRKMVAKMSICERWEFRPSPASPLKGQTASLWQRLHCCVRRPCQPRTEATRRSADGILHSVSLVPMVLQVCFRRDCNCEPGHVLLVSLTPSQPHFPAACLHLHLCTCASNVCGDILENRSKHFEAFMPYKVCNLFVYGCMYVSLLCEWKIPHVLTSVLSLFFPFLCHPPNRLFSCLTRVFVSSSEEIENTTCRRLFGELSLVLYGRMFIILSL